MKKKYNNKLITEMNELLDKKKSLTIESLVFNESNDDFDEFEGENEYELNIDNEVEANQTNEIENNVKPIIGQIRKIVLQGISQLAEYPECETYATLKKIWQMVDKATDSSNKNVMKESRKYSLNE